MRPVIGILGYLEKNEGSVFRYKANSVNDAYVSALSRGGAIAFMLPYLENEDEVREAVSHLDGLLVPGGADVSPHLYGEEKKETCHETDEEQDIFQLRAIRAALDRKIPVVGFCRGLQIINTFYGGTLYQDLPTERPSEIDHRRADATEDEIHTVKLEKGSVLERIYKSDEIGVNTLHHQAIKEVGKGLKATAWAPDGLVEAIEDEEHRVLAVQWHPEALSMCSGFLSPIFPLLTAWAGKNDD